MAPKKAPFQHAGLSDEEIFRTPIRMLTTDVFVRLAHSYSNKTMFARFNAAQPGLVNSESQVSARLYRGLHALAKDSGRSVKAIRAGIDHARRSRGTAANEVIEIEEDEHDENAVDTHANDHNISDASATRLSITQAPRLGPYISFFFVGPRQVMTSIHTALVPGRTGAILEARRHVGQQERTYQIDATPEVFEVYRLFLYMSKIFSASAQNDQDRTDRIDGSVEEAHVDREWEHLARLYFLGLDLQDERFRNAVIDSIIEKVAESDRYPTCLATEVYTYTAQSDQLRSLIVDFHVWKGQGKGLLAPHIDASGPPIFDKDVMRGLTDAGSEAYNPNALMPWEADPCRYHVHTSTLPCVRNTPPSPAADEPAQPEPTPTTTATPAGQQTQPARRNPAFKCDPCDRTFPSYRSLLSHSQHERHKDSVKALAARTAQQQGS